MLQLQCFFRFVQIRTIAMACSALTPFIQLQSELNFMYHCKLNVDQEELNYFLAVADE